MLEDPQTHVALLGTNATFVCRGHGTSLVSIDSTFNDVPPPSYFEGRGITLNYQFPANGDCNDISQWTVIINASVRNNNTVLYCHYGQDGCRASSNRGKLIVVADIVCMAFGKL